LLFLWRNSAAAATAAAIAPADVPPMFLSVKRYAMRKMADGYTIPLVTPPFITMSQNC
jgi:hypothetical protein